MHQYVCKYSNNDHRSDNYKLRLLYCNCYVLGVLLNEYKLGWGLEKFLLHSLYKLTSSSYFYEMIVKYLFTKSNF